jgi:hypothetical protein
MAKARRPTTKPAPVKPKPAPVKPKPAPLERPATKPRAAATRTSPAKAAVTTNKAAPAKAKARGKKVPNPYDPEYEKPLSELPPLIFPNSEEYEFKVTADQKRRSRVRNEIVFGAVLVLGGLIALVAGHTPSFLSLAAIGVIAMAGYELIISGLE